MDWFQSEGPFATNLKRKEELSQVFQYCKSKPLTFHERFSDFFDRRRQVVLRPRRACRYSNRCWSWAFRKERSRFSQSWDLLAARKDHREDWRAELQRGSFQRSWIREVSRNVDLASNQVLTTNFRDSITVNKNQLRKQRILTSGYHFRPDDKAEFLYKER